jgi:hypothetical protein
MSDRNLYLKEITSTNGQIAAQVPPKIARSITPVGRSWSRTVTMVGALLFLAPIDNVAFADANSVALKKLGAATSQVQSMIGSMSMGCSGGSNGVPPVNWSSLQSHGNLAVNAITAARLALTEGQKATALQQITSAEGELDALVNGVHNNCSGGCCGEDPVGFGGYLATRAVVKQEMEDVKDFLQG